MPPHSRDLAEFGSVLRRRRWLVVICLLAGLAGGIGALAGTPRAYTATAEVQVLPTGVPEQVNQVTQRQREPLNLDTEAQIAQSSVVAAKAAEILKNTDPEALRNRVRVDVPPNSGILRISFIAPDSLAAAAGAQAFADAYLRHRADAAQQTLLAQMKILLVKLRQVNASLGKVAAALAPLTRGSAERAITAHQQAVLSRQSYNLTLKYDTLRTTAITPGSVISQARPPMRTSSPSPPLYLGSGLFLGILTGALSAFTRDRLDTRLRVPADIERLTTLPLLAEIPAKDVSTLTDRLSALLPEGPILLESIGTEATAAIVDELPTLNLITSGRASTAILLIGLRKSRAPEVNRAARNLTARGTTVLGALTVRVPLW
ncbi:YveK family protein [Acrocarpospora pleiomorpha]|uniref:YveK family protein n=1 Tax=Acrocarpospora pleiomorpha TaxID=90975 RepID=UPI0014783CC4|nr:Wzz/FepE/Etk N-terminal domain-containing protein [Acrocarpospora pleiomorpha]